MLVKRLTIVVGSLSLAALSYLYYIKRCYKYLKSIGYDGPVPQLLIGNLLEFACKENSVLPGANKPVISHYSKTLQRWTKTYGKIYGYYEGHSPVLVLADADLVTEVFLNQNKLLSHRRSFPMSKRSDDPNGDIFTSNGIRWLRVRYGMEKVMLNNRNLAKCLDYGDESFVNTFINQQELKEKQDNFNLHHQAKLLMIQTMFQIIFGVDVNKFVQEKPVLNLNLKQGVTQGFKKKSNLYYTRIIEHKFSEAFQDFESFSLLKFVALLIPELDFVWRGVEKFKRFFNSNIYVIPYLADPMDWFYSNFINKHLLLYTQDNEFGKMNEMDTNNNSSADHLNFNSNRTNSIRYNRGSRLQSQTMGLSNNPKRGFCYFNSFLYLTYNPIMRYHQNEANHRKNSILPDLPPKRNRTASSRFSSVTSMQTDLIQSRQRIQSLSVANNKERLPLTKSRHHSTDYWKKDIETEQSSQKIKSTSILSNEIESEDFENWKLTINEALSNTLLMFFAGFETTSTAMGFCSKVISALPEQREKLLDEINDFWDELNFNLEKYNLNPVRLNREKANDESESDSDLVDEDNDDVFEDEKSSEKRENECSKNLNLNEWNDLYDVLDKMKYLDIFVKEVLRMFPIANSMVSRKCVVDNLTIDNGNYYIPKGMNIVVDVLSIHYDPVLWGPVDPDIFYPERFLTERNPAAWLAFGIGARKCLGIKLAMSQIKLFIVRLLQNYAIEKTQMEKDSKIDDKKLANTIETKDILFTSPISNMNVSIAPRS